MSEDRANRNQDKTRQLIAYHEGLVDGESRGDAEIRRESRQCLRELEALRHKRLPGHAEIHGQRIPVEINLGLEASRGSYQLGRFEIVRELGRGGNGIVYEAYDPVLRRSVALKLPRPETLVSAERRWRFLQEAQAVAALNHPHLVPVYEVGEIGPACYIASAYCAGPTLAQWMQSQQEPVDPKTAVRLVATLAETMQYVHSQGILHRDLKPSNVLLESPERERDAGREVQSPNDPKQAGRMDAQLVPKLTDFGLAKLFTGQIDGTATGAVMGTPAYMAPEQAEGRSRSIGLETDVYALGAILYELLTGRPPFRGESDIDVLRQVAERSPVAPRRLRPDFPRDLEAVCLKCLDDEPQQRYRSAGELADDLKCFLADKPVSARPSSPLRRLGKWSRRQPVVAGLAGSLLLAVLAGFAAVTWQWRRAEAHRNRAEDNLRLAEENFRQAHQAVREFNTVMFEDDTFDDPAFQPLRHALLETSLKYYKRLMNEHPNDPGLRFDIGEAMYQAAFAKAAKGDRADALQLYRESLPIWKRLTREQPETPEHWHYLAKTQHNIGLIYRSRRQRGQAAEWLAQSLTNREKLVNLQPGNLNAQHELAYSYHGLGNTHLMLDHDSKALELLQRACTVRERILQRRPDWPDLQLRLGETYYKLALVHVELGELAEALPWCRRARNWLQNLVRKKIRTSEATSALASVWRLDGDVHRTTGDNTMSLASYERSAELFGKLSRNNPESKIYAYKTAKMFRLIGKYHYRDDRNSRRGAFEKAVELYHTALQHSPDNVRWRQALADCYKETGESWLDDEQPKRALRCFKQARRELKEVINRSRDNSKIRTALSEVVAHIDSAEAKLRE